MKCTLYSLSTDNPGLGYFFLSKKKHYSDVINMAE